MEGSRAIEWAVTPVLLVGALALAGCGDDERQDAREPSGAFPVDVEDASFPRRQRLAQQEAFRLRVRNTGSRAVPNLAVTLDSFSAASEQAGLAAARRPVWVVDEPPPGGGTAYTDTWALGRLAAGQARTFTWRVTATQAGTHTVRYRVAAGLNGRARAVLEGDRAPEGEVTVRISSRPAQAHVDPETGDVVREGE